MVEAVQNFSDDGTLQFMKRLLELMNLPPCDSIEQGR